ncbi:MAG: DDE-type integrase/transposase/recombinase [Chloroflexi bacterium]|nr:DDE-type integrase/transposase/recombinase [Chloroflexota bacterium]
MELSDYIEEMKRLEAMRRKELLGTTVDGEYSYNVLRQRSRAIFVPVNTLYSWWYSYKEKGLDGLMPTGWTELKEEERTKIDTRYKQLGSLADAECISVEQIAKLADKNGWSYRTAERWLSRYRIGGLFALVSLGGEKEAKKRTVPELMALDSAAIAVIEERLEKLGNLDYHIAITDDSVKARAAEVGISPRQLWQYISQLRKHGLAGLAPKSSFQKETHYQISERIQTVIKGIRLDNVDYPIRAVYETACQKARLLGEAEPSLWQVRVICDEIAAPVKLLADKRRTEFRNNYRFTHRVASGQSIIYMLDDHTVDVLVKDMRQDAAKKSGEVRPYLTLCMDEGSRLVISARFSYDQPDRFDVTYVIGQALLAPVKHPFGGVPDRIKLDNGKNFKSLLVKELVRESGIDLEYCAPYYPEGKGTIERFFGTLIMRLFSALPGYVSSNSTERNPAAKAKLTIVELETLFWEFVEKYHNEVHSEIGITPVAYWQKNYFVREADSVLLDLLLKEPEKRRIIKEGIKYKNRLYWAVEFASLVGQDVIIRSGPYEVSDEIEVFYDGQWLCTAVATDSEKGKLVTGEQVKAAQRNQREALNKEIKLNQEVLKGADKEIEKARKILNPASPNTELGDDKPSGDEIEKTATTATEKKEKPSKKKLDLLERMEAKERKSEQDGK